MPIAAFRVIVVIYVCIYALIMEEIESVHEMATNCQQIFLFGSQVVHPKSFLLHILASRVSVSHVHFARFPAVEILDRWRFSHSLDCFHMVGVYFENGEAMPNVPLICRGFKTYNSSVAGHYSIRGKPRSCRCNRAIKRKVTRSIHLF